MLENLISLPLERNVLAALAKYVNVFLETETYISELDFVNRVHQTIFCVIRSSYLKQEILDKVLLSQKIKNLGISFQEEVPIFDYIENLYCCGITERAGIDYVKELIKLRICRDLYQTSEKVKEFVNNNKSKSVTEIIEGVDKIQNDKINLLFAFNNNTEPVDLFNNELEIEIEELGNNPKNDGIYSNLKTYTKLFGGFSPGNLFFFVARAKTGKSTLLSHIAFSSVIQPDQNIKVLMLDTEMDTKLVQRRIISSLSDVNEFYIRTGLFRRNKEMLTRVRNSLVEIKKYSNKIDHIYVGGMSIDGVISLARRWYRKKIGHNNNLLGMIILDYVKLSDELSMHEYSRHKDYQIIANKVDKLKRLATELQCPILTAGQTNRLNEERKLAGHRIDSGAVVGLSDSINALSSSVMLLNKFTMDEVLKYTTDYNIKATHTLLPLYCRNMGEFGVQRERVRIQDGDLVKYEDNRIFLNIFNFAVHEVGDLYELEQKRLDKIDLQAVAVDNGISL